MMYVLQLGIRINRAHELAAGKPATRPVDCHETMCWILLVQKS